MCINYLEKATVNKQYLVFRLKNIKCRVKSFSPDSHEPEVRYFQRLPQYSDDANSQHVT